MRKLIWIVVVLVLLNAVYGCATATQLGLGLGRTLQAAGEDTQKVVKAVSKE